MLLTFKIACVPLVFIIIRKRKSLFVSSSNPLINRCCVLWVCVSFIDKVGYLYVRTWCTSQKTQGILFDARIGNVRNIKRRSRRSKTWRNKKRLMSKIEFAPICFLLLHSCPNRCSIAACRANWCEFSWHQRSKTSTTNADLLWCNFQMIPNQRLIHSRSEAVS